MGCVQIIVNYYDHQVDLVMPEICPKSASLRNFILQRPYLVMICLPLPVITHQLRTWVMLALRGWSASCSLAFRWTISGRSLFFTMALSCKRSLACLATHFLLALSLLIIFSKPRVGVVLIRSSHGQSHDTATGAAAESGTGAQHYPETTHRGC